MPTPLETQLLAANEKYAQEYNSGGLPLPPSKKAAIITCMDARLNPAAAYGLDPGSVIVIRNAGASARDAARSTLLCEHLLGIEEVYVIKHTKCGVLGGTTKMVHDAMTANLGAAASKHISEFEPLTIADLDVSAKEDVSYLREHPLALAKVKVTGWIHDTDTGRLKKVVE